MKINSNTEHIITWVRNHFFRYPTNINLGYLWSFGSLAGFSLGIQIITGLLLTTHYQPAAANAYMTIEHIARDVTGGWLLHYLHGNGASFFFIVLYIHIFRSLLTASFSKNWVNSWISGVIIFILVIATAFFGYVLPWGQMSLWGATVITNLFSAVPLVGNKLVLWLWGGFSVDTPTIGKFFTLHFLLPLVIMALAVLHIIFLHEHGSSSQIKVVSLRDQKVFLTYFAVKDLLGMLFLVILLGLLIIFKPNLLGHPDNYTIANQMITPVHIVPEWYFLPFYAILRSVPSKLNGVILMFASLIALLIFPFLKYRGYLKYWYKKTFCSTELLSILQGAQLNIVHLILSSYLIIVFIFLGWLGGKPAVEPYTTISLWLTVIYFLLLLFGRMVVNRWHWLVLNKVMNKEIKN